MKKRYLLITSIFLTTMLWAQNPVGSPVATHGLLKTKGNRIVGKASTPVSLAGNSLFWSQWGGEFYNTNTIQWLKDDWHSKIIRAAMAVDEKDGYITNPSEKQKVFDVVDACIAQGLYVIIDWHSHHAENYKTQSIAFFKEMATKYGHYPNVIYEVYNEPLDITSWSQTIKPYAVDVVAEIRKIDPDNLILVGTRTWSQEVVEAANDRINDPNLAYVLHFYVGSHGQYLRDKAQQALNLGLPIFVSEWGVWGSDADLDNWMQFLKDNQLSWCNWAVATKDEPSSVLSPSASPNGNWGANDLTAIGKKVRNYMRDWSAGEPEPCTEATAPYVTNAIPGILEAENFDKGCPEASYYDIDVANQGKVYRNTEVDIEACTDAGGGHNVAYIEKGEWLNYTINIKTSSTYKISARVAALNAGGGMKLMLDDKNIANEIAIPATNDWQNWTDVTFNDVALQAKNGAVLKVWFTNGLFNFNRLEIKDVITEISDERQLDHVEVFPTVFENTFELRANKGKIQQLQIFNAIGSLVLSQTQDLENSHVFGTSFAKGTYLVLLTMVDGSTFTQKVVKQ